MSQQIKHLNDDNVRTILKWINLSASIDKSIDDLNIRTDAVFSSKKVSELTQDVKHSLEQYIQSSINGLTHLKKKIVDTLPSNADAEENILYLVKDTSVADGVVYNQYVLIDGVLEPLGNTSTDMSNYYNKDESDAKFALLSNLQTLIDMVGNASDLETTAKDTLVSAINEIKEGLDNYITKDAIVTTLADIGLTADATFQDVIDALPKGGSALLGVKDFTNYQTIFPYEEGNDQFSRVYIVKGVADGSAVYARWFRKDGVKEAIAIFNINDNKFGGWKEIATMDKVNALHKSTTGYITGSLLGSVVKDANLYYQKFGDNRLVINGWVSIDAVSIVTPIFTLPNNWKANSNYLLPCYVRNSNVACACKINIDKGTVEAYTPIPATSELRFCGEIYLM